jgi:hypothetical protein
MGTLPVIAVIGAAFATAMKMTATMPMDPFFSPFARAADVSSVIADSALTRASQLRIEHEIGPATKRVRP